MPAPHASALSTFKGILPLGTTALLCSCVTGNVLVSSLQSSIRYLPHAVSVALPTALFSADLYPKS